MREATKQLYYIVLGFFVERKAVSEEDYWAGGYHAFALVHAPSPAAALGCYYQEYLESPVPAGRRTLGIALRHMLLGDS